MTGPDAAIFVSVGSALIALGTYAHNKLVYQVAMERRMADMEAKTGLFWKIVEQQALQILHHPTRHELDDLLDRYAVGKMNNNQAAQLVEMLMDIAHDDQLPAREISSALLLAACIQARYNLTTV